MSSCGSADRRVALTFAAALAGVLVACAVSAAEAAVSGERSLRERNRLEAQSNQNLQGVSDFDFAEGAGLALFVAREAVSEYGGDWLEPEHILLGIVRSSPELMRNIAPSIPADFERSLLTRLPGGERRSNSYAARFGQRAVAVVLQAGRAASADKVEEIDTRHLLIGLVQDSGGAGKLLRDLGVTREKILAVSASPN